MDELTHDTIDYVLETLQAYCACRDDCEGCRYGFKCPGEIFTTCALREFPGRWKVEKIGGEDKG